LKDVNDATDYGTIPAFESLNVENLKITLNQICSKIASRYNLFSLNGEPRRATIIDILSTSTCVGCIVRRFQQQNRPIIDAVYLENHRLAVGMLVEQLHSFLAKMGYKVSVLTEARLEHSTADILIAPTNYGVNLQHCDNKIVVEVKTGNSLSRAHSQLLRSLIDIPNATVVLWRIKRRQVAVIRRKSLQPMLLAFMRMCILRGERVLAETEPVKCQHSTTWSNFTLSSKEFENTIHDFADALMDTLPTVMEMVLREIRSNGEER